MNDRFKFRVWDKGNEQYLNLSEVDYLTLDTENGGLIIGFLGELMNEMTYMPEKDMVVEQCTGLKDKNGNLIYENDLIIAPNNSHKLAIIRMENGVYGCKECRFNGVWEMNLYDLIKHYGVEIIGNIHKQPEQKDAK